jgi:hypothetical protein
MDNPTPPVQTATPATPATPASATVTATPGSVVAAPSTTGENGSEAHHGAIYNPQVPAPQIINGVKIFPTSYIPARAELHAPKEKMIELKEWHIEGIHIFIFLLLTVGLFIGMWKRPNLR